MSRWRSPASRALDGQRWRGAALWAANGAVALLPLAVDMVLLEGLSHWPLWGRLVPLAAGTAVEAGLAGPWRQGVRQWFVELSCGYRRGPWTVIRANFRPRRWLGAVALQGRLWARGWGWALVYLSLPSALVLFGGWYGDRFGPGGMAGQLAGAVMLLGAGLWLLGLWRWVRRWLRGWAAPELLACRFQLTAGQALALSREVLTGQERRVLAFWLARLPAILFSAALVVPLLWMWPRWHSQWACFLQRLVQEEPAPAAPLQARTVEFRPIHRPA